jgi:hypothetical protein
MCRLMFMGILWLLRNLIKASLQKVDASAAITKHFFIGELIVYRRPPSDFHPVTHMPRSYH